MKILELTIFVICVLVTNHCLEQENHFEYLSKNWKHVATRMPDEWYGSAEARMAADSVLKYQTIIGGWIKNSGFHNGAVNQEEWARVKSSGIGATFDNGATITELRFLAKIYSHQKDERYKQAFLKGMNYIFISQYDNGGWPQFFPVRKGGSIAYSGHITYNDGAMVNTMLFLKEIHSDEEEYSALKISSEIRAKARELFDKGIQCILKTQIIVDNRPTVWCAQHDEKTLAPANARSYELASFSGSESVGITELLMEIENPSQEIIQAVDGAIEWFDNHRIKGIKVVTVVNEDGEKDRVVVEDAGAPDLWARFYDLETGRPFFCSRDGIKKDSLAEISYNRRNGYSWYTSTPEKILSKYTEWKKKHASCN